MPATKPYETKTLGEGVDATAPDGTAVRLLLSLAGGSMAHFELPAGAVSHAVTHRTVEEIWFVVSGRGAIWRRQGDVESIDPLGPGTSLTIPLGAAFQFRADAGSALAFVAITMPPWPGMEEAVSVAGPMVAHRRGRLAAPLRAAGSLIAQKPPKRRISSAVEQRFCKPKVGGSIPSSGTKASQQVSRQIAFRRSRAGRAVDTPL